MAILDYSGILNRGVKGGIQRSMETQGALQGLRMNQQSINQNDFNMQQRRQQAEAQQQQAIKNKQLDEQAKDIYKSGDVNAIADFSVSNPERAERILKAQGVVDAAGKRRVSDRFANVLTSTNPKETLIKEIVKGRKAGLDMSNSEQILAQDLSDEEIKKAAGVALASIDGGRFKGINEAFESQNSAGNQSLTTKQRDFATYQQLKKTNPEEAKIFAVGAGFMEDDKKKVFQIVDDMKVYSDGSTEKITPVDPIKYPDMARAISQKKAMEIIDKAKEGQLKNAGFAITMNDGTTKVNKMMSEGYDPTSAAWINKYLSGTTVGNLAMTEEDQVFVGAVEQMINAIARRETGAAITEFERKDFFNRYMPVAGDKPQRIKQKKAALERQFKSIRGQAGSVYDAIRVSQGFDAPKEEAIQSNAVNWSDLP